VCCLAVVFGAIGAGGFHAYPTIAVGSGAATLALSSLILLAGLAPRHG
jgi:hypothetical protein